VTQPLCSRAARARRRGRRARLACSLGVLAGLLAACAAPPAHQGAAYAPRADGQRLDVAALTELGRALFFEPSLSASGRTACASCHDPGRSLSSGGALHLSLAIAPALPTPSNLIHLTLEGIAPPDGAQGRSMPGFAGALTNDQVTALVQYLRVEFGRKTAWRNVDEEVASAVNDINAR